MTTTMDWDDAKQRLQNESIRLYRAIRVVEFVMKDLEDIADSGERDEWLNRLADRLFNAACDLREVFEYQRRQLNQ